jgi:hypothetical protein
VAIEELITPKKPGPGVGSGEVLRSFVESFLDKFEKKPGRSLNDGKLHVNSTVEVVVVRG